VAILDFITSRFGEETCTIPVFPLNAVLFPGSLLPLKLFEQRYMDMAKVCLSEKKPFGVCLIKEGSEVGAPATPEIIGCLAHIIDWDMQQLGLLHLNTLGGRRFQISEPSTATNGLISAQVALLPEPPSVPLPPEHRVCAKVLHMIVRKMGEERFNAPFKFEDAEWVGYRLAEALPLKPIVKQKMLEMNDTVMRLEILHKFLASQGLAK